MSAGSQDQRHSERADRQAANLARHLNQRHPDTVLFLVRCAAGQRNATTAELLAVEDAGVTVTSDAVSEPVQIAFGETVGSPTDARSRLRHLLEVTRAANAHYPLTSLEQQMRT